MMRTALSFVVLTKYTVESVVESVISVFTDDREPLYGPRQLTRYEQFKFTIQRAVTTRLPPWIKYQGNHRVLLETQRGKQVLDTAVERIPALAFDYWQRFSIGAMVVLLVLWTVFLIALVPVSIGALADLVIELYHTGFAFGTEPATEPQFSISPWTILLRLLQILLGLPIALVITWTLLLPIIPGLAIHEFGHYAALKRADVGVEGYGLILIGPMLGGAYVRYEDATFEEADVETRFAIAAGGIGNSILWATTLVVLALILLQNPITTLTGDISWIVEQPLPAILLGVGLHDVIVALLNAFPAGSVDGGRFVDIAEEWVDTNPDSREI